MEGSTLTTVLLCCAQATELRQLRAELQIDKSQALKAQEERLSRELRGEWTPLGPLVEQASRGCQTGGSGKGMPPDMDAAQLEASLKVRPHLTHSSSYLQPSPFLPPTPGGGAAK